jgi:hypothetical protein
MLRDGLSDHELMRKWGGKFHRLELLVPKFPMIPPIGRGNGAGCVPSKINVRRQGAAANGIPVGRKGSGCRKGMEPVQSA